MEPLHHPTACQIGAMENCHACGGISWAYVKAAGGVPLLVVAAAAAAVSESLRGQHTRNKSAWLLQPD